MATAAATMGRAAPPRRRASLFWMAGLASGAILALNPATVILLFALFAPTMLLSILAARDGAAVRGVFLCDAAAAVAPLVSAWRNGPPELAPAVVALLSTPIVVLPWLAASTAWVTSELVVAFAQRSLDFRARRTIARLEREITSLRAEWE